MRMIHFTIITAVLFIISPLNGYSSTSAFHDADSTAGLFHITSTLNTEENRTYSNEKSYYPLLIAQSEQEGTEDFTGFKPQYNISIQNQTNDIVTDIEVKYGSETFNIDRIEGHKFRVRKFVEYEIPGTAVFQWQDHSGKKHIKEVPVPETDLNAYFLSTIYLSIVSGNNISIQWQGHGNMLDSASDEFRMKDAVTKFVPEIKMFIEMFSLKSAYVTVDENYNELCYQYIKPKEDNNCAALAKSDPKVKYYETLEDIIDIVIYSHNKVDKEVSPYNSKPLFTKAANSAGQIAILPAGKLEVKLVAYDKHGKTITEVNVKSD